MVLPDGAEAFPVVYLINLEDRGSSERKCKQLGDACIPSAPDVRDQLLAEAAARRLCVSQSDNVYALNYSNGDPVNFVAYRFDEAGC